MGHNSVRAKVLGMDNRPCTDDELRQMKELVAEAMELGVPGFSSGLTYTPGMGATNEEIVALAQVVSEYGGIYTTHMSNYSGAGIEKAMDFAVETAWKSGMRLQFSHVAPHGEELYGKGQWLSDLIGGYRARGVDCCADVPSYPTIGVWWGPRAIFPGWLYNWKKPWPQQIREIQDAIRDPEQNARIREHIAKVIAGDKTSFLGQFFTFHNWDSIFLFECRPDSPYHKYVGQSVQQIADAEGMDGTDLYFDLCLREGEALSTVNILEKEEDRKAFFQSPWTMFGSDIYAIDAEHPDACFSRFQIHPRNFGHAIYVIETIVQKNRWLTLEQAIHKMSGLTASHFNMHDRRVHPQRLQGGHHGLLSGKPARKGDLPAPDRLPDGHRACLRQRRRNLYKRSDDRRSRRRGAPEQAALISSRKPPRACVRGLSFLTETDCNRPFSVI